MNNPPPPHPKLELCVFVTAHRFREAQKARELQLGSHLPLQVQNKHRRRRHPGWSRTGSKSRVYGSEFDSVLHLPEFEIMSLNIKDVGARGDHYTVSRFLERAVTSPQAGKTFTWAEPTGALCRHQCPPEGANASKTTDWFFCTLRESWSVLMSPFVSHALLKMITWNHELSIFSAAGVCWWRFLL